MDRFDSQVDGEVDLESGSENYDLGERLLAGYLMAEFNLTADLLVLPGLRYVASPRGRVAASSAARLPRLLTATWIRPAGVVILTV